MSLGEKQVEIRETEFTLDFNSGRIAVQVETGNVIELEIDGVLVESWRPADNRRFTGSIVVRGKLSADPALMKTIKTPDLE